MTSKMMNFELAADIVAGIEARVGKVGEKTVNTSNHCEKYGAIVLSRGGVVIPVNNEEGHYKARNRKSVLYAGDNKGQLRYPDAPELTVPVFRPELAIVKHLVGVEGRAGLDSSEDAKLSDEDSRVYVFSQGEDHLWRAFDTFDTFGDSSYSDWLLKSVYYLDAARPIESAEGMLVIQSLVVAFDTTLAEQTQKVVAMETGLII